MNDWKERFLEDWEGCNFNTNSILQFIEEERRNVAKDVIEKMTMPTKHKERFERRSDDMFVHTVDHASGDKYDACVLDQWEAAKQIANDYGLNAE